MRALRLLLFTWALLFLLSSGNMSAQLCYSWSSPQPFSDSISDNVNVKLVNLYYGYDGFYLFWERHSETSGNEILCKNYYLPGETLTVIASTDYNITNPQVISTSSWGPNYDTLAYIFFQTNLAGNEDLYYVIMTNDGFSDPVPFATEPEDETHLRVSQGGGMAWQEGDKIKYSRLNPTIPWYSFKAPETIDTGECRNPDIQNVAAFDWEQMIVWEKGSPGNKALWHCIWNWAEWDWSPPFLMINDGNYSNPSFTKAMYWLGYFDIITMDYVDSAGLYHYAAYDHFSQEEFISESSQSTSFQPDLFTMDIPTDDFWGVGYIAISAESSENLDIFSNDDYFTPWTVSTCQINSTPQPDRHPQLFQGQEGGDCFDLLCVWESFRNGHWQLYSSSTLVIIGGIDENIKKDGLSINVYPNPFHDFVNLEYSLTRSAAIKIQLFDACGRIIKTFDEKLRDKGIHEKMISIPEIPSGTYLIKVESDGIARSKVIIKR